MRKLNSDGLNPAEELGTTFMAEEEQPQTWQFRVYFEDTDAGGMMYRSLPEF
jgi:hypothetical protein